MKVVFCTAEVAPFSQAGGLGDVAGSLPKALAALPDVDVTVITPMYGMIDPGEKKLSLTGHAFTVSQNGYDFPLRIWQGQLPGSTVPVYLVENYDLFGYRKQVYPYGDENWELQGFMVFSEACFELLRRLNLKPDVMHAHDWHTASIVTRLYAMRGVDGFFGGTRSVLTIHNLNYQGVYGNTNWLKEGIWLSDALTTVSPNYAREIQTPEFGAGLDWDLREVSQRAAKLSGILNGIDTTFYNPATDAFITRHYDEATYAAGKAQCKEALQVELGLPVDPQTPLIGFVGRLTDQKGVDILVPAMEAMRDHPVQWALLGSGDPAMEARLKDLNRHTERARSYIGFNTAMAQKIYAGADMFVMPSRFEPCGLGQLIALRYGSVPVVRGVGGLVDTVFDVRDDAGRGNGFVFHEYSPGALVHALEAATAAYHDQAGWQALVQRGMHEDHSWGPSALAYRNLYAQLLGVAAGAAG